MVEIRLARTRQETDQALDLAESVWGERPVSQPIARAMDLAGWYLALASEGDEVLGMCAGFVGVHDDGLHLHSHLAAVAADARGRGIGRALKWHQRSWCLEHGIETVTWTFDPLVRENARFNLHHLGAIGDRYVVDLYGEMNDEINRGQPSDRLLVRWDLRSERVERASRGVPPEPVRDEDAVGLVPTPESITELRRRDPDEAGRWRMSVRDAMEESFAAGLHLATITADGIYLFTREHP